MVALQLVELGMVVHNVEHIQVCMVCNVEHIVVRSEVRTLVGKLEHIVVHSEERIQVHSVVHSEVRILEHKLVHMVHSVVRSEEHSVEHILEHSVEHSVEHNVVRILVHKLVHSLVHKKAHMVDSGLESPGYNFDHIRKSHPVKDSLDMKLVRSLVEAVDMLAACSPVVEHN